MAKRICVLCYSRTGATARLAREAARLFREGGAEAEVRHFAPVFELPYLLWLLLSFVPRLGFPLRPFATDLSGFDALVLAFPKWTLTCPPVETALRRLRGKLPPTALLVSCGGWDEERYIRAYTARLGRGGVKILGGAAFRRDPPELASVGLAARVREWLRALGE